MDLFVAGNNNSGEDGMTDLILCIVGLFFIGWVLVLKIEISDLRKELDRIKELLKTKLGQAAVGVEVSKGRRAKPE
jgi:hypothetical protein